jgi:hypothetical protein
VLQPQPLPLQPTTLADVPPPPSLAALGPTASSIMLSLLKQLLASDPNSSATGPDGGGEGAIEDAADEAAAAAAASAAAATTDDGELYLLGVATADVTSTSRTAAAAARAALVEPARAAWLVTLDSELCATAAVAAAAAITAAVAAAPAHAEGGAALATAHGSGTNAAAAGAAAAAATLHTTSLGQLETMAQRPALLPLTAAFLRAAQTARIAAAERAVVALCALGEASAAVKDKVLGAAWSRARSGECLAMRGMRLAGLPCDEESIGTAPPTVQGLVAVAEGERDEANAAKLAHEHFLERCGDNLDSEQHVRIGALKLAHTAAAAAATQSEALAFAAKVALEALRAAKAESMRVQRSHMAVKGVQDNVAAFIVRAEVCVSALTNSGTVGTAAD